VDALESAIAAGNVPLAVDDSEVTTLGPAWNDAITPLIADTAQSAILAAFNRLPIASIGYSFNLVNPRAVEWATANSSALLTGVSERSIAGIRNVIATALSDGMYPEEAARLVGQVLGLSERDAKAVQNYRKSLLANQNPNVEKLVKLYTNRLLRTRGEAIARTETMAAANEGARLLWQDLFSQNYLKSNEWERRWLVAPDERVCPFCRPLSGKPAPVDGVFEGGIQGPPRHSRCRCTHALYRVAS